jgi:glucokinase
MNLRAGIDLGGTKVAVGLMEPDGTLRAQAVAPTEAAQGFEAVVERIARQLEEVCRSSSVPFSDVVTVGIAAAGQVDRATGDVRYGPNLGWTDAPIGRRLAARIGRPVSVDNDVRAAALGEYLHGLPPGRRPASFVAVYAGTGVGAGWVLDGRLVRGHRNTACEVGHHSIAADGVECSCGNRGCLELYASGRGLARRAREAARAASTAGAARLLVELAGGDPDAVDAHVVRRAAEKGDTLARDLVRETGRYLGVGLANIVNLFNPEVVLLGGGLLLGLSPDLAVEAQATLRSRALAAAMSGTEVLISRLGAAAGVIGAASLGRLADDGTIRDS